MRINLPTTEHRSYKKHRKQVASQILLPFAAAVLVIAFFAYVIINLTITNEAADLPRWAAISTIWLILPTLMIGIFLLILLAGMIYLLFLLLRTAPVYTKKVQDIVYKGRSYTIRGADLVVRPVIFVEGLLAHVQAFFGRK